MNEATRFFGPAGRFADFVTFVPRPGGHVIVV
jgi:hypothetical protein